jgi:hypothetical protein
MKIAAQLLLFYTFLIGTFLPLRGQLWLLDKSLLDENPAGPVLDVPSVYFLKKDETGKYVQPDLVTNVSLKLSNFQIKADGIAEVITFGAASRETIKWPKSELVFQEMKALGRPISSMYTVGDELGQGIFTGTHHAYWMYASIKHLSKSAIPKANESQYLGDLTIEFNRPVSNPHIHLVGLGAMIDVEGVCRGYSVELELITPQAFLEHVSGSSEFGVSSDRIFNKAKGFNVNCGDGGACGTAAIIVEEATSIKFKVLLRRDGKNEGYKGKWPLMRNMQVGDGFMIGLSFDDNIAVKGSVKLFSDNGKIPTNKVKNQLLRANILDPNTNKVLASKSLEEDGSFIIDGFTTKTNYFVQISTLKGIVGESAPETQLPIGYAFIESGKANDTRYVKDLKKYVVIEDGEIEPIEFYISNMDETILAATFYKDDSVEAMVEALLEVDTLEHMVQNMEMQHEIITEDIPSLDTAEIVSNPNEKSSHNDNTLFWSDLSSQEEDQSNTDLLTPTKVSNKETDLNNAAISSRLEPNEVLSAEKQIISPIEAIAEIPEPKVRKEIRPLSDMPNPMEQNVVIVGSFQSMSRVNIMKAEVERAGLTPYIGPGPGSNIRIGFIVAGQSEEDALTFARQQIDPKAWLLSEDHHQYDAFNTQKETILDPETGDCIIIVGSFAIFDNARKMQDKVASKGLALYQGPGPGNLTRVGFYLNCAKVASELTKAKQLFDKEAWVLPSQLLIQ